MITNTSQVQTANIQIVDDNPINLMVLSTLLAEQGYKIRTASNGTSALASAQRHPPDLILLDIMMPKMSGYEVCERLKADEHTRDIPVIFISARAETLDKVKAFSAGGVDYITKPFQPDEALARIETHLSLRRLQQQLGAQNTQLQQEVTMRQQAEQQVRSQNSFLQSVLDSLPHPFYVINVANYTVEMTNEAVILTDLQEKITCYALTHQGDKPCDPSGHYCPLQQVKKTGQPVIVEHTYTDSAGRSRQVEVHGAPIFDDEGNVTQMIECTLDITERKRAEETLQQAKEVADEMRITAEAANQAKSVFLSNMSHELRTPLNAILGFSQLMQHDPGLNAEQQENVETIGRSGEHLLALINDILDLSKIEAGRVELQVKNFDLYHILQGLEEIFCLRAEQKRLTLTFERTPDVPQYIRADQGKLHQVLINLLSNAVKFTEKGGVILRLGVRGQESGISEQSLTPNRQSLIPIFFEVEDTGPGISPTELENIFDAFVQTISGHEVEGGTGLGLPISRKFVQLMGGEISVESPALALPLTPSQKEGGLKTSPPLGIEGGEGTTFRFEIPVEVVDAAEVETKRPSRRVVGLQEGQYAADGRPYRLLIVEDVESSRQLLIKLLQPLAPLTFDSPSASGQGFEVREAVNGQEAIAIWEEWQPHLIWMDMRMPVMDGYEATKFIKSKLKAQDRKLETGIIALAASACDEDRERILAIGCDDFVRKPFREHEIFEMLRKHLGIRFVYAEGQETDPEAAKAVDESVLTFDRLQSLPQEWLVVLQDAAEATSPRAANEVINQIRAQDQPLAEGLAELVKRYRFDTLQALFGESTN